MKPERLGFASAIAASTCCAVPAALAFVGLGSLGWVVGRLHWILAAAAVILLGLAWGFWIRETRAACCACDPDAPRKTRTALSIATLVVGFFLALDLYSAFGGGSALTAAEAGAEVINLPVNGMTCVSCEHSLERKVKKIDGVLDAHASAAESRLTVKAKPGAVKLDAVADAVRAAGYEPVVE